MRSGGGRRGWRRRAKGVAKRGLRPLLRVAYHGRRFFCPVCGSHLRRMRANARRTRPNVRCPVCDSLERHRLDWLFLRDHTPLCDGAPRRMLHFAPEPCLERRFRAIPELAYVSCDLESAQAMLRADIRHLPYPDGAFDVIYCSHVLEHVEDDRRAMRELRRVLAPGGFALLQVPIAAERTSEDPSVRTPEERRRVYGHPGHVRFYGMDFAERVASTGFRVRLTRASELVGLDLLPRLSITPERPIFLCHP